MALIKCRECGKEISDKASACPNCAYPIEKVKMEQKKSFENLSKDEKKYVLIKYRKETEGKKLGLLLGLMAFIILLTFILPVWLCFISLICLVILIYNLEQKEIQNYYEKNVVDFDKMVVKSPKEKKSNKQKFVWKIILGVSIFLSAFTTLGMIFSGEFITTPITLDVISIIMITISISQIKK